MTKKDIDGLSYKVMGAAIEVHKSLGQGLLESVYHKCLEQELNIQKIKFKTQVPVPIVYKDFHLATDLRCDLFIENCLVVELKAVDRLIPIFEAQLMTYLKLLKAPKGIIINFNCINLFKDGQKTYVTEYYRALPEN